MGKRSRRSSQKKSASQYDESLEEAGLPASFDELDETPGESSGEGNDSRQEMNPQTDDLTQDTPPGAKPSSSAQSSVRRARTASAKKDMESESVARGSQAGEVAPKKRRPRRLLRYMGLLLASGTALLAFAPTMVSLAPVRAPLLKYATAGLPFQVDLESASLNWWSSIQLKQIAITAPDGEVCARVAELRSQHSLLELVLRPQCLGQWTMDAPELEVHLRPGGSNWEDLIAKLPASSSSSANSLPSGTFNVRNGIVHLHGGRDVSLVILDKLQASVELTSTVQMPIQFTASGNLADSSVDGNTEPLKVSGAVRMPMVSDPNTHVDFEVTLANMPLRIADPLAVRLGVDLQLAGSADGSLTASMDLGDVLKIEPCDLNVSLRDFSAKSSHWNDEVVSSSQARIKTKLAMVGSELTLETGQLNTDWAEIQLQGRLRTDRLTELTSVERIHGACEDLVTQGTIDLAPLVTQLPRTLDLRDDLRWKNGNLSWDLRQELAGEATRWIGNVEARDLAAEHAQQLVTLSDPLRLQFRWTQQSNQGRLEELVVQSAFLDVRGQGDLNAGELKVNADLNRLTQEAGQFLNLGDNGVTGQLEGQLKWQTDGSSLWQATSQFTGKQLQWTSGSQVLWRENALTTDLSLKAKVANGSFEEVAAGELHLVADKDLLDVTLRRPVRSPWETAEWSVDAKLAGQLATWQNRLRPFLSMGDLQIRGDVQSQFGIEASPAVVTVSSSQVNLRNLLVTAATQRWHEPVVQLQAQGAYEIPSGQLDCRLVTLASTSVSMRADQLTWPLVVGKETTQVQFRGDLAKIWQQVSPTASGRPRGQVAGRFQLVPASGLLTVRGNTHVQDFQWETRILSGSNQPPRSRLVWQEPSIDLTIDGQWGIAQQSIQLKEANLKTSAAQIQLHGDLQQLQGPIFATLQGTTRLDMDQLTTRLQPLYGDQIRLVGTVDRPFLSHGPLLVERTLADTTTQLVSRNPAAAMDWVSPELKAQAGFGWQSAHVFGFDLSAASVDAKLDRQTVSIQPIDMTVSGGKLHLEPQLRLQDPPTITLAAGRVADQVTITPGMCKSWLKFVAPLVADATAAEGKFSVDLQQMSMPVLDPTQASIRGTVGIHSARIGPGPLAQEILNLVQQVRAVLDPQSAGQRAPVSWVVFPEQQVVCRMESGRIVHENLLMMVGDIPIRTQGWVGLDNQLSLVAEVPIREEWVRDKKWLAGLRGQPLRIPIRGSVQRPQLDRSIVQQLGQQALRGSAEGILQDEVQRQMNKLLPELFQQKK